MGPWSCSNDHLREAGCTSATPIATAHRSTIARTPKLPTFLPYSTVPVAQSAAVSLNLGSDIMSSIAYYLLPQQFSVSGLSGVERGKPGGMRRCRRWQEGSLAVRGSRRTARTEVGAWERASADAAERRAVSPRKLWCAVVGTRSAGGVIPTMGPMNYRDR